MCNSDAEERAITIASMNGIFYACSTCFFSIPLPPKIASIFGEDAPHADLDDRRCLDTQCHLPTDGRTHVPKRFPCNLGFRRHGRRLRWYAPPSLPSLSHFSPPSIYHYDSSFCPSLSQCPSNCSIDARCGSKHSPRQSEKTKSSSLSRILLRRMSMMRQSWRRRSRLELWCRRWRSSHEFSPLFSSFISISPCQFVHYSCERERKWITSLC